MGLTCAKSDSCCHHRPGLPSQQVAPLAGHVPTEALVEQMGLSWEGSWRCRGPSAVRHQPREGCQPSGCPGCPGRPMPMVDPLLTHPVPRQAVGSSVFSCLNLIHTFLGGLPPKTTAALHPPPAQVSARAQMGGLGHQEGRTEPTPLGILQDGEAVTGSTCTHLTRAQLRLPSPLPPPPPLRLCQPVWLGALDSRTRG